MRLAIKGEEISIILQSDRELTTQEIIAAHQLSTGNFEALFVKEGETEKNTKVDVEKTDDSKPERQGWVEKGEVVNVEVMCPFCGFTGKTTTHWKNSFCKCPSCREKLYNKFSTGVPGEKNSYGCVYLADEPMVFKNQIETDEKMFEEAK
ncbi:hypothetical protein [Enterococcus italicus]|uniref:hypothetical protein n=1 Tax=Enterococcus italicus TaxID=246144 RepID=UPI003F471A3B